MKNFDRLKVRLSFTKDGVKTSTVVSLDGFYVNALESIGIQQKDVPRWLTAQLLPCKWFDPSKPITRQIKALILLTVITELSGDTKPFYN